MAKPKKLDHTIRCPMCGAGSSIVMEKDGLDYCLACHGALGVVGKKLAR